MKLQRALSLHAHAVKRAGLTGAAFVALSGAALAFTTPTAGQLGYDLYNIVVNQGVLGPVGFMAAVLMLAIGVGGLIRGSIVPGVLSLIAAATLFAADQIVTTLGFVV